jgi:AcrR family transcriptional regulator
VIVVKNTDPTPRPRGRPRSFDRDAALAVAMETFWRLGYEGASIADLTAAMGITPQSLYAAFGSKAELYREALGLYRATTGSSVAQAFAEAPTVSAAFERVFTERARTFARPGHPAGCMISTAVLTCARENEPIADHLRELRSGALASFRAGLERGKQRGEFRPDLDVDATARFLGAMIQGMAVQARDGASEADLKCLARFARDELARQRA